MSELSQGIKAWYLKQHNINSIEDFEKLSHPLDQPLHDVDFLNLEQYLTYLDQIKGKVVTVDADYDADGVLSGTLLACGLELFGISQNIHVYYPKAHDGYGLTPEAVNHIKNQFNDTQVLLTADNGGVAKDGVMAAETDFETVLVSDHHLAIKEELLSHPESLIDPNQLGDNSQLGYLSGTGVVWELFRAYGLKHNVDEDIMNLWDNLSVLVGISVVTDVMPMKDDNRYFVKAAIDHLNSPTWLDAQRTSVLNTPKTKAVFNGLYNWLKALRETDHLRGEIDETTFGFTFGPMLNAPRRMNGDPALGYQLFESGTYESAIKLIENNDARKDLVRGLNDQLVKFAKPIADKQAGLVAAIDTKEGIAGLIAGNLMQVYPMPIIIFAGKPNQEVLVGSARSPKGVDLYAILTQLKDELVKFGGHAQAAGLAIERKNISQFKRDFAALVKPAMANLQLEKDYFEIKQPLSKYDISDLWDVTNDLNQLAPFGNEFEPLKLGIVAPYQRPILLSQGKHTKWTLDNGLNIIKWNEGKKVPQKANTLKAVGQLSINEFRGNRTIQMIADSIEYD